MSCAKADHSKQKLLKAAKKLFATKGFDGVSVKELADEAGVNVSLVSYHFDGKMGLYRACIGEFGKERLAATQRILQPVQSQEEFRVRLQMFIEEFLSCQVEESDLTKIIHRECELEYPMIEDIFQTTFLKAFQTLVEFLSSAKEAGFLRKDLDPLPISAFIHGALIHMAKSDHVAEKFFKITLKSFEHRKKVAAQIVETVLEGVLV